MDSSYWKKQQPNKALFDDVLWSKPERRDQSGRLTIVGGNNQGFWAVASAYQVARSVGVGEVRVIMPDSLRSKLPPAIRMQMDDLLLVDSNPSGGLAMGAKRYIDVAASWSGSVLFIGDNGANSETAQLMTKFITDPDYTDTKITVARDAVDILIYDAEVLLNRPKTTLVVGLSQFQKLARAVYYPRMIAFSQGVKQMAETLHKFTTTYPATIVLFHNDNLIVASNGQVVSQPFDQPMRVWSGEVAGRAASWQVWQTDPLKAIATSWVELT